MLWFYVTINLFPILSNWRHVIGELSSLINSANNYGYLFVFSKYQTLTIASSPAVNANY